MSKRYKLFARAGDTVNPIQHECDIVEHEELTEEDLDAMAWDFAIESIQAEYWWEEVTEEDE